jgi:hypothetical protein
MMNTKSWKFIWILAIGVGFLLVSGVSYAYSWNHDAGSTASSTAVGYRYTAAEGRYADPNLDPSAVPPGNTYVTPPDENRPNNNITGPFRSGGFVDMGSTDVGKGGGQPCYVRPPYL